MSIDARVSGVIALNIILGLIILFVVGARLWTRHVLQKSICAEDILILLSSISTIGALVAVILAVIIFKYGLHTSQLTVPELVRAGWFLFVAEFAYIVISSMIKFAILLFYLRLGKAKIGLGGKIFRWTIYGVMVEIVICKTIYLVIMCTACTPLPARWLRVDPVWEREHHFTCPTDDALNIMIGSAISAVEDLVLAILPAVLVWNMQIPTRTKVGIWLLFSLSIGTSITGFVRAYVMWQGFFLGQKDWIFHLYWTWILAMFEVACGLICSSVPSLKPFFKHFQVEQKLRGFFRLTTRKTTTTTEVNTPHQTVFFRDTRVDTASLICNGTTPGTSKAEVTWTSTPTASEGSPVGVLRGKKSCEMIVEEEIQEINGVKSSAKDSMWIQVRQSVTIDRQSSLAPYVEERELTFEEMLKKDPC